MRALTEPVTALMRAVAAAEILPRYQRLAAGDISEKTPGDLVTVADHASELRLTEGLMRLLPDGRVVGEEAVAADPTLLDGLDRGAVWLVDPLDGTGNFAAGRPPFAVMVALLIDGERQAGWMLDPVSGRLCHAIRDQGAFIDGERVHARSSGADLPVAALATYFMDEAERAEITRRAAGRLRLVDIPRCAGEQYPRIVLGANDVSVFVRSLPWDHAPGALFLEEAGGRISRLDGNPYVVADGWAGLLAAATPALWDRAAAILFD